MQPARLHPFLFFSFCLIAGFPSNAQQPAINSFTPGTGASGTAVTINGSGFDPVSINNIVYFGACRATVQSASANSLVVTCPPGASYDYITVTTAGKTAYSSKPFIVSFPAGPAITPANFGIPISLLTENYPRHSMVCDLDDNGKPDLVVIHTNVAVMSIFRNTSAIDNISFASRQDVALPASNLHGLAKADIDGDGKPDLVVGNYSSNSISVFRNTSTPGTISLAGGVVYPTEMNPDAIAIADLDLDGKPDIAACNQNSNNVSIFRNLSTPGSINLATRINFATGLWPNSVAAGDVDGDGRPDLVIANFNSGTTSVLHNTSTTGTIAFSPKVDFTAATSPAFLALGDMDGDDKPDLAVTNSGSSSVSLFRNTSTGGTISFAPRSDVTVGNTPWGISMADVDGDTKPDLAVANFVTNTLTVLKNNSSTGTINFVASLDIPTGGSTTRTVNLVDLDGDSKPDITCTKSINNIATIFRNQANEYSVSTACINSTITLTSEITGSSYIWETRTNGGFWGTVSNGGNYSGANTATLVISNIPGSFDQNQYRCLVDVFNRSRIVLLKISSGISPSATIQTTSTTICSGSPVTITSSISNGGPSPSYQWQVNGVNAGTNSPSFITSSLLHGDQVRLVLTSNLSCASPAVVNSNTLSFTSDPVPPVITATGNVLTITNPDGAVAYSWEKFDAGNWIPVFPAVTGPTFTATVGGPYRVKGVKGNCTVYSNSINVIFTAVADPRYDPNHFRLFPNPVRTVLWIDSLKPADQWETLEVIDHSGRKIIANYSLKGLQVIKLGTGSLPAGMYFIILRRKNDRYTTLRFIKI